MPTNGTARGVSALTGFGLLLTVVVLAYLNSTTSVFVWSTVYIAALVVVTLAMCSKWALALGVESKLAEYADKVMSIVPIVALFFNGIQALHYHKDGLDGFMAGIAIMALAVNFAFGLVDTVGSWFGQKYKAASDMLHEGQRRMQQASEALSGRH